MQKRPRKYLAPDLTFVAQQKSHLGTGLVFCGAWQMNSAPEHFVLRAATRYEVNQGIKLSKPMMIIAMIEASTVVSDS